MDGLHMLMYGGPSGTPKKPPTGGTTGEPGPSAVKPVSSVGSPVIDPMRKASPPWEGLYRPDMRKLQQEEDEWRAESERLLTSAERQAASAGLASLPPIVRGTLAGAGVVDNVNVQRWLVS